MHKLTIDQEDKQEIEHILAFRQKLAKKVLGSQIMVVIVVIVVSYLIGFPPIYILSTAGFLVFF
jgi:hypothetical protein